MKTQIHLNQVGYIYNLSKTATVISRQSSFSICKKATGFVVYMGQLSKPKEDIASGDLTSTADFSEFQEPGEYYIKVGAKKSFSFSIAQNPYYNLKQALLKAYYFNRCGTRIYEKYAGIYKRKKCHVTEAVFVSNTKIKLDVSGGWHDSGQYDREVISAATALGHLLYAYALFPESFEDTVNIPESGNGIPDILNECRYELNWLLKMQDKDGGVYHNAATNNSSKSGMPADDHDTLFVYDKSDTAAAYFSAVTALASRIYKEVDIGFSQQLKCASTKAWIWLLNNSDSKEFKTSCKCECYENSDKNLYNEVFWAASELYHLTGEKSFNEKLCAIFDKIDTTAFTCCSVGGLGALSYIMSNRPKDALLLDALKTAFIYKSDTIVSMSKHSGYGTAKEGNRYLWGSNMGILTNAMVLIIGNIIAPDSAYIITALEQVNYILGKNPMGISYVTGFGEHSCAHPHHRACMADGIDAPIKGLVVGGPNMLRSDEYSRWMIPKDTPPAKCYIDKEYSYSTNEVAIYWNSPAVFVFGFFSAECSSKELPLIKKLNFLEV